MALPTVRARLPRLAACASLAVCLCLPAAQVAAAPPEGYRDYDAFHSEAEAIAESDLVQMSRLGQTAEGRDVVLLTVSSGAEAEGDGGKPAILILGSVEASNLVGSHLAMEIARGLADRAVDGDTARLLDEVTFYIIPRPSPDASERRFARPLLGAATNARPSDDDRDGEVDEDPPEDLNGDGVITMMRVADEAGAYLPHPEEPRLLIEADATKGERGVYRLLPEGADNDGDERWNEDPVGGVDFNRNFTFRYPYFKPGAGPHQVSEPETRAVADFAYDHPNIFLVFSFAPQDNLNHPWKPKSGEGRIKRAVQGDDAKHLKRIAERYKELVKPRDAPPADDGEGAFAPWAYYHYGRWSIATRGWWPTEGEQASDPKDEAADATPDPDNPEPDPSDVADPSDAAEPGEAAGDDSQEAAPEKDPKKSKKKPDARGKQDMLALRWLDAQAAGGFVDWTPVEHPDFPGKRVEVGGFVPGARWHPPVDDLNAEPLVEFLAAVGADRARVGFLSTRSEALGNRVVRVTAEVINRGGLPTVSEMGQASRQLRRLAVELSGPEGIKALAGDLRQDVGVLGPGEVAKRTWLVRLPEGADAGDLRLKTGEPSVGFAEAVAPEADANQGEEL